MEGSEWETDEEEEIAELKEDPAIENRVVVRNPNPLTEGSVAKANPRAPLERCTGRHVSGPDRELGKVGSGRGWLVRSQQIKTRGGVGAGSGEEEWEREAGRKSGSGKRGGRVGAGSGEEEWEREAGRKSGSGKRGGRVGAGSGEEEWERGGRVGAGIISN
ncbi:hypothetical protein H6P81_013365 [Aristolochia fimbriata]|uniref:Uncharacterized protein n=1 Tax=Aristolochia fimbriata TaxID=158543 RepID=A0AAV7EI48_ARIFI|nr:hypothetical protein H6P81_013365 [Aristolochia fimbriata]